MAELTGRSSWKKRALLALGGLLAFLLIFAIAIRITVSELYDGIASSKATGLSAVVPGWDVRSMWSSGRYQLAPPMANMQAGERQEWIARSADLQLRSPEFERSVATLHQIVAAHHGYLEDLRTESRTGTGRALEAMVSVPSGEFDAALSELQNLGRVEIISQAGEDSAVKLATAARCLEAAKTNLTRLQALQRDRRGELRDAVALEKDIAQANDGVAEAERQQERLASTVAQANIHVGLLEDYRAPLQVSIAGAFLEIRNSIVGGIVAILVSICAVLGIVFGYGLPIAFWVLLLFWPVRMAWRRLRREPMNVAAA
jgi:Domain of unknown function (DUF4349)